MMLEYAILWNLNGFPAGTLPVTEVTEDEQSFEDDHNDSWTALLNESTKGSKDLPISV